MKALVLYGPRDLRLEEMPDPVPRGEWVRIRVRRVGICGTDKAFYKGTYPLFKKPLIPGHEIAGIIDMVGNKAPEELVGKQVTTEINIHCRKCWYCRHGMPTHCPYRETIGISRDGGMAEYVLTRYDLVYVTDKLTMLETAFVEPLASLVEMTEMAPIQPMSFVAVIGVGTIGLLALQVAKLYNPQLLVAITRPGSPKADLAKRLGADMVLTYDEALEVARKETPEGQGFDYVVEATGSPQGLDMAISLVRPRGVIAAKSTHGSPVSFNYTLMVVKEARIIGSRCGPFDKAIKLLEKKKINVESLVTSTYRLDEGVEAFRKSFERDQVKVHLIID